MAVEHLAAGHLPEMHCWVALHRTRPVLIDVTTRSWPAQCAKVLGQNWPGDLPPDYLWSARLPAGVVYQPRKAAIVCALTLLEAQYGRAATERMAGGRLPWPHNKREVPA